MAEIGLLELAYIKALDRDPLTRDELAELAQTPASELILLGSIAEAAAVRMWVRHESYRQTAQDLMDNRKEKWGSGAKTRTYPFYVSD